MMKKLLIVNSLLLIFCIACFPPSDRFADSDGPLYLFVDTTGVLERYGYKDGQGKVVVIHGRQMSGLDQWRAILYQ